MTSNRTFPTLHEMSSRSVLGVIGAALLSVGASFVIAGGYVTQRIAHSFGYDFQLLGLPLLVPPPWPLLVALTVAAVAVAALVLLLYPELRPAGLALFLPVISLYVLVRWPIYPPHAGLEWLREMLQTDGWRLHGFFIGVQAVLLLLVGLGFTAALVRLAWPRVGEVTSVVHGSARFATRQDLAAADLLSGDGLVLAALNDGRRPRALTDRSGQHALIVMPPGSGKTTGPIACSLLNTPEHSALVLDPKGELYELTAGWRQAAGQRIVRFAPHEDPDRTERWNPLDEVMPGEREVALISTLAANLVTYPAESHGESHWTDSAQSLLRCLLLHQLYVEKEPSLVAARDLLASTGDGKGVGQLFKKLATAVHDKAGREEWACERGGRGFTHPEVATLARRFGATPPRERGSIVSTLSRFLDLWGDPRVAAATRQSSWRLSWLTDPKKPTTVYVTAPFNELVRLAPLLRVLVAMLVYRLTDDQLSPYQDVSVGGRRRVLLVLDEFASLGRIPLLEEVLAFLRGYGVTAMLAVQDIGQIHRLYTRNESFSGTCGIHINSATANLVTRSEVSRRVGETTVSYSKASRTGSFTKRRTTRSRAEVRRPLLTEGEVGALEPDRLLVIKAGYPAVLGWKMPYWRHALLRERAAMAPPVKAGGTALGSVN